MTARPTMARVAHRTALDSDPIPVSTTGAHPHDSSTLELMLPGKESAFRDVSGLWDDVCFGLEFSVRLCYGFYCDYANYLRIRLYPIYYRARR